MKTLIILSLIILIGCSNPSEKKYSKENHANDIIELEQSGVSKEDIKIMESYIALKEMQKIFTGKNNIEYFTYQNLLDSAHFVQKQANEILAIREKENQQKRENELMLITEMNKYISIIYLSKEKIDQSYKNYLKVNFKLENISDKNISGVKFEVIYKNIFGDEIHKSEYNCEETVNKNSSRNYSHAYYTILNDATDKVIATAPDKLTVEITPKVIVFEDKTKIEI